MTGASAPPSRYRDALAIGEFRAIFVSQVISTLGAVIVEIVLTVTVYDRSRSALLAALVLTLSFLPYLFTGVFGSSLIDRFPTRALLISCNLASAVTTALMAVPTIPVPGLLVLAFALGSIAPVFAGARAATLPEVLPAAAFAPGRSLLRIVAQGGQIVGFAVGGVLLAVMPPNSALLMTAGCFLGSAAVLRVGTRERPCGSMTRPRILRDSLAGLGSVLRTQPLGGILTLGWAVPFFAAAPEALLIPYARQGGAGGIETGLLMAAMPTGFVLGEVLVIWYVAPGTQIRLIPLLSLLSLVSLLGYSQRPNLTAAAALLLLSGMGGAHHLGLDRLLVEAPSDLRARALNIQPSGLMFAQGVGFLTAGAVAESIPIHVVVAASAGIGTIIVAICLRNLGRSVPYFRFSKI